jgi:hypothetical protein
VLGRWFRLHRNALRAHAVQLQLCGNQRVQQEWNS